MKIIIHDLDLNINLSLSEFMNIEHVNEAHVNFGLSLDNGKKYDIYYSFFADGFYLVDGDDSCKLIVDPEWQSFKNKILDFLLSAYFEKELA